jgi:hypothetical protein
MRYLVRLSDDTVGAVDSSSLNGLSPMEFDYITVTLNDENGNIIEVSGKPEEILEERY